MRRLSYLELMRRQFPRRAVPFSRQRGYISLNRFDGFGARQPAAGGGFLVDAADFDGTNDYLSRASSMTGQAASKSGIVSMWCSLDVTTDLYIFTASNDPDIYAVFAFGDFVATDSFLGNTESDNLLATDDTARSTSAWYHLLFSWNGATGVAQFYINDVAASGALGVSAANVDTHWNLTDLWTVGIATDLSSSKYDGGLAEIYVAPNQYLDMTDSANRRKFISVSGKPVDLGVAGATPTGTAPLIYLHLSDGEAPANFATNRAGNGDFTVTGTLTTYATSPSD